MKNINFNKFLVLLTIWASTLSLTAQKVDLDPWLGVLNSDYTRIE